jgi:hypothetical protein
MSSTKWPSLSPRAGGFLFLALAAVLTVAVFLAPRTPQPLSYHDFADQRSWLGIPNFGDVASNIPFAVIGMWGLLFLASRASAPRFRDAREKIFYFFIFAGLLLTAFGSAYYHLAPDNNRLVWDRLPMTIVFMALIAAMIAERVSLKLGLWLLAPLLVIGAGSVAQWHYSELRGEGDLRFYAAVQTGAILALLVALALRPRYTRSSDLAVAVGFYVLAKVLETFDPQVLAIGNLVSGHTLKHLAAAASGLWILKMVMHRVPIESSAVEAWNSDSASRRAPAR